MHQSTKMITVLIGKGKLRELKRLSIDREENMSEMCIRAINAKYGTHISPFRKDDENAEEENTGSEGRENS